MIDPDVLLGNLLTVVRDNPTLVTLLGNSSSNVTSYSPTYPTKVDLASAIHKINPPGILIAWTSTQIGDRSQKLEHLYSAFLVPNGKVAPVFTALREGVITTGGQKFKRTAVMAHTDFPDVRGCFPRQIAIGEAIFEIWEVPIRITERGVDE